MADICCFCACSVGCGVSKKKRILLHGRASDVAKGCLNDLLMDYGFNLSSFPADFDANSYICHACKLSLEELKDTQEKAIHLKSKLCSSSTSISCCKF